MGDDLDTRTPNGVKNNMNGHLKPLRYIFQIIDSDTASNQTYVDCAVTKFGIDKVFGVLVKHMPPVARVCSYSNLHPLMIAASYETSALSVIYYFVLTHHC